MMHVTGVGLWTPGYGGVESWRSETRNPEVTDPAAALLNPRLKRRTSLLTRMSVEVAEQASRHAGGDLSHVPSLFASAYGEAGTSVDLLHQLHADTGALSPTKFHNSVHNTASGYFSIACENRSFSSSIAAGWRTLAMALLEAWTLVTMRRTDVLLVIGEETLPPPLDRAGKFDPLAVAFYLSAEPSPKALARLGAPAVMDGGVAGVIPETLRQSPASMALELLQAVLQPRGASVRLEPNLGAVWSIKVDDARP